MSCELGINNYMIIETAGMWVLIHELASTMWNYGMNVYILRGCDR